MRVNLKALGLALVAALAMSAVAASAVHAVGDFTAASYPAVAKGSQEGKHGEGKNYFEITNKVEERVECETATYQATQSAETTVLTVTPHYAGCTKNGTSVSIALNGCYFKFETTGTDAKGNTTGTADVVCPVSTGAITIRGAFGICEVHVPGEVHSATSGHNQNLAGVTFTNVANGDVTVDVDITGKVQYIETDTSFCPFGSESNGVTQSNGNFVSSVLMQGYVDKGGLTEGSTGKTTYNADLTKPVNIDIG